MMRILAASVMLAQDWRMMRMVFLAVEKNTLHSVVVTEERKPAKEPSMNLSHNSRHLALALLSPFLIPLAILVNLEAMPPAPERNSSLTAYHISANTRPMAWRAPICTPLLRAAPPASRMK